MGKLVWFKMYPEARTDRKLDTLSDAEHRVWFHLLCYSFEQGGRRMTFECDDADALAVEVAGGDAALLSTTLAKLVKPLRIMVIEGDRYTFINGEARQYDKPSDQPEEVNKRVTRHRNSETPSNAVKRDVTPSNAVSPLEESRVDKRREERSSAHEAMMRECNDLLMEAYATFPTTKQREQLVILVSNYGDEAVDRLRFGMRLASEAKKENIGFALGCAAAASKQELDGSKPKVHICLVCNGSGKEDEGRCTGCLGTGRRLTRDEYEEEYQRCSN